MPMRAAGLMSTREDARALALQVEREVAPALLQQLVREAVRDERVEALEVEQRLDVAAAGRIAVVDGGEIGAERAAELGLVVRAPARRSAPIRPGIDVGMVQPLRQAVADGVLQPLLAQDGRIDEAAERRLGAHRLLGLAPQLRPDRIDRGDAGIVVPSAMCAAMLVSWGRRFQGRNGVSSPCVQPAKQVMRPRAKSMHAGSQHDGRARRRQPAPRDRRQACPPMAGPEPGQP